MSIYWKWRIWTCFYQEIQPYVCFRRQSQFPTPWCLHQWWWRIYVESTLTVKGPPSLWNWRFRRYFVCYSVYVGFDWYPTV